VGSSDFKGDYFGFFFFFLLFFADFLLFK